MISSNWNDEEDSLLPLVDDVHEVEDSDSDDNEFDDDTVKSDRCDDEEIENEVVAVDGGSDGCCCTAIENKARSSS